jgi:catechol 2,3-dioxygenase-like lactoylglutathione lyase family enzyme
MITTNGLNHLALPVKDPELSAQFYADLFNMEIISSSSEMAFLKTVGSKDLIALSRSKAEVVSGRETMHFKSIKKVSEPGKRDIGRYIFIEDLDGYTVEVFEYLSPL